jgi:hypothetical protein
MDRTLGLQREAPHGLEKSPAGLCQFRAVRNTAEQRRANLGLQVLDLLAERRLADAKMGGRAGEIQFFRNSQKVSDVTEFHRWAPNLSRSSAPESGPEDRRRQKDAALQAEVFLKPIMVA